MKLKRISRGDRALDIFLYMMLTLVIIICAYPVYFILLASVSNSTFVNSGELLWYPKGFHLEGFKFVFQIDKLLIGYGNTIFYTVCGTILGLFCSLTAGYSLSRKDLPGHGIIMFLMVFTMYFSGGLIPTYLLIRDLGMYNTRLAIIIPGMVNVWYVIVCRTNINSTIPEEMFESASIDGCGYWRFFTQFVVPLCKPVVAVIMLWVAIGHWNSFFNAMLYLTKKELKPLQLFLRDYLITNANAADLMDSVESASEELGKLELVKNSLILLSVMPLWILYPFIQKFFVKGVMVGSVKG